jgi:SpoVK/Ycf46/Vps4 family AAA+-type ATPase
MTSGLIGFSRNCRDLEDKFDLIDSFSNILLTPHETANDLICRFLKRASAPTITLDHFPHLAGDSKILRSYFKNALSDKTTGVNVLLHGQPGVGKTEYVKALALELGVDLYEISFVDEDGDPIKGERRLRAYNLCQSLLARTNNAMLLFDEIEDVFPSGPSFLRMMFDKSDVSGDSSGKAWINRTLEQNPVPAIWISNQISHIDPAYLRRFDYSIKFCVAPAPVRLSIARHHFNCFNPPEGFLERIVANEQITPGQFDHAAKVARIAGGADNHRAIQLVEQTLDRSAALLSQKRLSSRNIVRTSYSLEFLNTDADIPTIVAGLKLRPRGTFCFYGATGTGKSELAKYIADQTGKQIMVRRASDIIDKYVGETEKNIAAMFSDARQQEALLVLDEADSFLVDRRYSQQNWEVTRVNELLTQMEDFESVFICTTNLMEKLDPASLRRFDFKVRFDPMKPDQSWRMFREELVRLRGEIGCTSEWEEKIRLLEGLTPGDFAVGARQFELLDVSATPEKLYEILLKECQAKGCSIKKIGFESNTVQYGLN